MTSRTRLRVLIVGAFTLLAFATHAETRDLNVVPAAQTAGVPAVDLVARHAPGATFLGVTEGIGHASDWCEQRRPHTGDTVVHAGWLDIDPGVVTARCAAVHPGASHFYYVTIWADGHVQWTPLGPWWT